MTLDFLRKLVEKHAAAFEARVREFSIGGRRLAFNREPAIMGVVNLSPDSWYRESVCLSADAAIERGRLLALQGAALVDVGAESTLAHAGRAGAVAQKKKLLPVIEGLARHKIATSVETYDLGVARACLEAGAEVLNLTGTEQGSRFYRLVAEHDAAVIICYVRGKNPREVQDYALADDPIPVLYEYFARAVEAAQRQGVEKIFLDPGLGFYYRNLQDSSIRIQHQMRTFLNGFRLRVLGFPICNALPHAFELFRDEVRSAEGYFAVLAALGKTDLLRTHEVARVKPVLEAMRLMGREK